MPNGKSDVYNAEWCEERHRRLNTWIKTNHEEVTERINTLEARLYGLLILGIFQLIGICSALLLLVVKR